MLNYYGVLVKGRTMGVNRMSDLISRQAAIDALENTKEAAR